jgi:hypothetical protein
MAETTANSEYPSKETEIGQEAKDISISDPENVAIKDVGEVDAMAIPAFMITNKWQRLANKLELRAGAEARGIERVDESLRMGKTTAKDYFNMSTIWFSVNLTVFLFQLLILKHLLTQAGEHSYYWCSGTSCFRPWLR